MTLDFKNIWAQNGLTEQPTNAQYLEGFNFLGAAPPTVELFNFMFQNLDKKALNLFLISHQWQPLTEYTKGDIVFSINLPSWGYAECISAGTSAINEPIWPGLNNEINDGTVQWRINDLKAGGGLPIGTIFPFLATKPPPGWLAVNTGAILNRATYPDLWAWVQENAPLITEAEWQTQAATQTSVGYYSNGDSITTFRLPRIVDFIRGSSNDRLPGSFQGDAIRNILGTFNGYDWNGDSVAAWSGAFTRTGNFTGGGQSGIIGEVGTKFDASMVVPTANENRPQNIAMLYCVKAFGAPVNEGLIDITELANDVANLSRLVPAGTMIYTSSNNLPYGYLKANGAAVLRTAYATLFAAIGTTYGVGDGSTTFNLPDARGEFFRGWTDGSSVDSERAFGSKQEDAIRNIIGTFNGFDWMGDSVAAWTGAFTRTGNYSGGGQSGIIGEVGAKFDASRVVPVANENRPRNIALLACIKY